MKTRLSPCCLVQPNQVINFCWRGICAMLLLHFSLTSVTLAQNKIWDKTFGGNMTDELPSIEQTSDGGYILGGGSFSDISGDKTEGSNNDGNGDYWVVKLRSDGTKSWDRAFINYSNIRATNDGGFFLIGASKLLKLNADGTTAWEKVFDRNGINSITTIQLTTDGGYIMGGTSYSEINGEKVEDSKGSSDYRIVKLSATGTKEWAKTFGGNSHENLYYLQQTNDGGYIAGGISYSGISGNKTESSRGKYDFWVVKLKPDGTLIWDKTIGSSNNDELSFLKQTSDGGYILGGNLLGEESTFGINGDKTEASKGGLDYWIIKLKADGTKAWDRTIGGDNTDYLTSLQQTNDGGFILGGYSVSSISGDKTEDCKGGEDFWVVKLKADGTKFWDRTIGGSGNDYLQSLQQTKDGNFILGGHSDSGIYGDKSAPNKGDNDYWVVKLDNKFQSITFDPILYKNFGDAPFALTAQASSGLPIAYSIVSGQATLNGNIITLTGTGTVTVKAFQAGNANYQSAESTQTFIVEGPSLVKKQWNKTLGGSDKELLTTMVSTPDGGYLLGGSSLSNISSDKTQVNKGSTDYWIVKTDKMGQKLWDKSFGGSGTDNLIAILATSDGGYLLSGSSQSGISGDKSQASKGSADYWLIKIDGTGKKLWDKTYGGNYDDILAAIITTSDGGFLLGGTSASDKSGDKSQASKGSADYWLIKIDGTGKKLWDKTYGGRNSDNLAALVTTANDGFLLGGSSASGISGDKTQASRGEEDYWVIRLNANGTKVWDKTFGGIKETAINGWCDEGDCKYDFGKSTLSALAATPDGAFLLGGSSSAEKGAEKSEGNLSVDYYGEDRGLRDYWVVKIDGQGNKIWDNVYGGINKDLGSHEIEYYYTGDSELKSIMATPDGGYVLAGFSNSDKGRDKNEDSRREYQKEYYDQQRYDYWVVKIDGNGQKKWDQTIGGLRDDYLSIILPIAEDGYVLGGTSQSDAGGDKSEVFKDAGEDYWYKGDYWIVKIKDETPSITSAWNLRYGGVGNEGFTAVIKTSDGGYLSGGYTNSGNSGDKTQSSQGRNDYWIVKSDKNGKKQWDKRYGGSGDEYLNRVTQTHDGGYLLAGSSLSGIGGDKTQASRGDRDYWIVKISSTGVKQWDKRFGGSGYDELKKVFQLSTGEYILAGYSNSPAGGDKSQGSRGGNDFWLVKVSSNGTKIWDKRYGGSLNEALGGIVQTSDGGFLLGGSSVSGKTGDKSQVSRGGSDFWLVRTDKNGNKLWDKSYGGSGQDEAYSLGKSGRDFFISGQSNSLAGGDKTRGSQGGKDFWFLKLSSTGSKIWDKRFGGSKDEELRASIQTKDGGYLLAGKSFSGKSGNKTQTSQGSSDYWIVKTDKDGMYQWDKRYGGSGAEELRAVIQTNDSGLLLAGKSESGVSGDRSQPSQGGLDYWLVKVAPETAPVVAARKATMAEEPVVQVEQVNLNVYPNPFSERATIRFTLPETQTATVKVYDSQGREVAILFNGEAKEKQAYELEWKAGNQAAGMYLLQLQTPTKRSQHKLLLTR